MMGGVRRKEASAGTLADQEMGRKQCAGEGGAREGLQASALLSLTSPHSAQGTRSENERGEEGRKEGTGRALKPGRREGSSNAILIKPIQVEHSTAKP
jgi:hypothetical protein